MRACFDDQINVQLASSVDCSYLITFRRAAVPARSLCCLSLWLVAAVSPIIHWPTIDREEHVMASTETRPEDQLAYDNAIASAPERQAQPTSTCFSPAASRHSPRRDATVVGHHLSFKFDRIHDAAPPHPPTAISFSRPVDPPSDSWDSLPSVTDDPFFRRYLGARHSRRTCRTPPLRNVDVNSTKHWPSSKDSLHTHISGVRCLTRRLGDIAKKRAHAQIARIAAKTQLTFVTLHEGAVPQQR